MPLHEGKSKKVIGENISEMEASGHPHDQSVAAALHNAHPNGGKNMADGGMPEAPKEGDEFTRGIKDGVNHDSDAVKSYLASKFAGMLHPGMGEDKPQNNEPIQPPFEIGHTPTTEPPKMADGGYPHVTFMEDQTPEENEKTTHLASAPKMAEGGTVHKAEDRNKEPAKPKDVDMSHEKKLNSIYKAMGIKKYADAGLVTPNDVDPSQLPDGVPPPPPSGPGLMEWLQNFGSKLINSPAGQVAGAVMNPVSAASDAIQSAAPSIIKAEAPTVSGVANAMTGGAVPAVAPPAPPAAPTPDAPVAIPPQAAMPKPPVPPAAMGGGAPQNSELNNLFNQDTSKLTQGANAEDRNALVNKLGNQQHSLGAVIAEAVSGLGDALAAKGGREQHSLQGIFSMQKEQRDEALANFDKARQDRIQKLALQTQMGNNSIQQLAAKDAYGTDEHLNKMLGAPPGTAHKDLPLYFQAKVSAVMQQEKDADLYMKAHAQAGTDVDNAVKNSSVLGFKPSSAQIQASGSKLADQYFNRAKGNILVKPSDGGQAQWIPAQNLGKAKQMDPNLAVQQ